MHRRLAAVRVYTAGLDPQGRGRIPRALSSLFCGHHGRFRGRPRAVPHAIGTDVCGATAFSQASWMMLWVGVLGRRRWLFVTFLPCPIPRAGALRQED